MQLTTPTKRSTKNKKLTEEKKAHNRMLSRKRQSGACLRNSQEHIRIRRGSLQGSGKEHQLYLRAVCAIQPVHDEKKPFACIGGRVFKKQTKDLKE